MQLSESIPTQAPAEPVEPDLNECCGNGCDPCVYDTYAVERRAWLEAMAKWEKLNPEQQS